MDEDNIVKFPGVDQIFTDENYGPTVSIDAVLEAVKERGLNDIIIIGTYDDSDNMYFASTSGDLPKLNWDLDRAKAVIMNHSFNNNDEFLDD